MTIQPDYVLGTHDDELARLGLQHRAWQSSTSAAWHKAGIGTGQTVLDVGCGPGYATLDLAQLVGASGRVIAIDKSEKFLHALDCERHTRGLQNIVTHHLDFDRGDFPAEVADAAWCRWVFAFLRHPRELMSRLAASIRPGGVIVIHEYFDYATWRSVPRCPELEEFVSCVMASWRGNGGEPDIALSLPQWLEESGFEIRRLQSMIDVVQPGDLKCAWVRAFFEIGRQRLVDLGYMSAARADAIWQAFMKLEATHGARTTGIRMITPGVLEIIAVRRP
jgi:SAM-dependent methyltransferase